MKILPDWPLFKDLGVTAFLLILITCATVVLTIFAFATHRMAEAAGALTIFGMLNTQFWNGYLHKREKDGEREERMAGLTTLPIDNPPPADDPEVSG